MMIRLVILSLPILLVGCCKSNDMYYWGEYQNVVYGTYMDNSAPEQQVEIMQKDVQMANSLCKPLPPGFHAQLGYLYLQLGNLDLAKQEFEIEKQLFPESTLFMDKIINKVKG